MENLKLYSPRGYVGRKNFFIQHLILYVLLIAAIFLCSIFIFGVGTSADLVLSIFSPRTAQEVLSNTTQKMSQSTVIYMSIIYPLLLAIHTIFGAFVWLKRAHDIFGFITAKLVIVLILLNILFAVSGGLFIPILFYLFMPGKITSGSSILDDLFAKLKISLDKLR